AARLLAARSRSFQRAARVVQPNVAAGHHLPRDVNVVVLDEDEIVLEIAITAEVNDVLDVTLAFVVARVGLAGENKLEGPLFVFNELNDIVELLKNQRRALIGRETAREADRQRVRVQQLVEGDEISLRQSLALDQKPPPGELDQFAAQSVAQRPDLLVG